MVLDAEVAARLKEVWDDPDQFRSRLVIENLRNRPQMLGSGVKADPEDPESPGILPEQLDLLNALRRFSFVVAIKPRQVGFTTLVTLWLFAKTYRAKYPHRVLQTLHEPMAVKRVRKMVEVAYNGLPPELQFGMRSSSEVTDFPHNGSAFHRALAGARGQGRGWTYNDGHFSEAGKYPRASSSQTLGDEEADSDVLASVQATIHDPEGQVIVESTGNGPYGMFYDLVAYLAQNPDAAVQDDIGFVFVPWSKVARYRRKPPPDFEPTDEERALMSTFGLDIEQIAWRRWKMKRARMTRTRFRREFPLTWNEPFLIETAGWFSADALNVLAGRVPVDRLNDKAEWRQWEPPLVGRRYFLGVDTCGGVGRDEAVIVVLRDDLVQVAQWQSKTASPTEQALMVSKIAGMYGGALVLVEGNKYGKQVLEVCDRLGVNLWRDDDNRFFNSTGAHAGDHKRHMMSWARDVIDGLMCEIADPGITHQLSIIVEKSIGNIEARDEQHDDRAIAFCLALWCARTYVEHHRSVDPNLERGRMLMRLARDHSLFRRAGGT